MTAKGPKIAVILGTRPEIVKLSALIRRLEKSHADYFILHTGQHYSYNMDEQFFKDLELPDPRRGPHYIFTRPSSFGANMHSELVAWMTDGIRKVLEKERPGAILVQGDTDTVLAGARAAAQIGGITIGHVEAGLRSYDMNMPEERNRLEADRLSHVLFAPTQAAKENLLKEKLDEGRRIEVTGNTIVDALFENIAIAEKKAAGAFKKGYALVTLHRPETVDNKQRMLSIFQAIESIMKNRALKRVVFPAHPRTVQRLKAHGMEGLAGKGFEIVEPMGFLDFIWHEKNADLVLTDSGGVQEESCIFKVPCVTLRTTTERPETVSVGANIVAGYEPEDIIRAAAEMAAKPRDWANPFGDGRSSERILRVLEGPLQ